MPDRFASIPTGSGSFLRSLRSKNVPDPLNLSFPGRQPHPWSDPTSHKIDLIGKVYERNSRRFTPASPTSILGVWLVFAQPSEQKRA